MEEDDEEVEIDPLVQTMQRLVDEENKTNFDTTAISLLNTVIGF